MATLCLISFLFAVTIPAKKQKLAALPAAGGKKAAALDEVDDDSEDDDDIDDDELDGLLDDVRVEATSI